VNSSNAIGAPFSTMNATRTPPMAVRRNQNFAVYQLGRKVTHLKPPFRNRTNSTGSYCVERKGNATADSMAADLKGCCWGKINWSRPI